MLKLLFGITLAGTIFFLGLIVIDNFKYAFPLSGFLVSYFLLLELYKELKKEREKKNVNILEESSVKKWPLTDRKMNIAAEEVKPALVTPTAIAAKYIKNQKKRKKILNLQHFFHSMHHTNFLFYYNVFIKWMKAFVIILSIYGIYHWLTLRNE